MGPKWRFRKIEVFHVAWYHFYKTTMPNQGFHKSWVFQNKKKELWFVSPEQKFLILESHDREMFKSLHTKVISKQ